MIPDPNASSASYPTNMPSSGGELTDAERTRFINARNGDEDAARDMISAHLAWRAATLPLPASAKLIGKGLPSYAAFLPNVRCNSGCQVLYVMGAMYDSSAGSGEEYTLALTALFEDTVPRDSAEKFTVVVDVRGGDGWPNPRPWAVVPWVRAMANTLGPNYPERLNKLLVLPVPFMARAVWSAVSAFLDETTAAKVSLLSGSASVRSWRHSHLSSRSRIARSRR